MGIADLVTDVLLILLPLPSLWRTTLSLNTKIQVSILFSVGLLVVAITVARLPLILDDGVTQDARTTVSSPDTDALQPLVVASNLSATVGNHRDGYRMSSREYILLLCFGQGYYDWAQWYEPDGVGKTAVEVHCHQLQCGDAIDKAGEFTAPYSRPERKPL